MKRQLTTEEIKQLEQQGCSAEEWTKILVHPNFEAGRIHHTRFEGEVEIGERVNISHVGVLKNFAIHDDTSICRVNEITCDKWIDIELCNEGITVGNEAGEPNIHFTFAPNEQLDWLNAHYPQYVHAEEFDIDKKASASTPLGRISENCLIKNCGTLRNVNMEAGANIEGAAHLEDGFLLNDAHIGTQVIAHKFCIGPRTKVTDGAKLYHVITTNDCKIGKGFMAENCYFGHHCEMFCGEACAIFAGPHTVSHHKSTLLIGGEFSFYNAGSNTNQSNHAYKLGPVHHGTLARGSKTASGSHILWPAQTAPFTMVMGKVKSHPDLSALPFSYVIAEGDKIYVAPGVNIGTAGTFRDVLKWRQRGKSPYTGEYDFLSPLVMQNVFKGINVLTDLQQQYGSDIEEYPYNGIFIKRSALLKGINRYQLSIRLYANKITPTTDICKESINWHWIDIAGLPAIEEELTETYLLLQEAEFSQTDEALDKLNKRYATQAQQWGAAMLEHMYCEAFTSGMMRKKGKQALKEWTALLIADARKELALGDMEESLVEDFILKVSKNSENVL